MSDERDDKVMPAQMESIVTKYFWCIFFFSFRGQRKSVCQSAEPTFMGDMGLPQFVIVVTRLQIQTAACCQYEILTGWMLHSCVTPQNA